MDNQAIFDFFDQITKIPRESGKEEKIIAYLQQFAEERSLEHKTDEAGNVVILKGATPGMEGRPTVVLQSHSDMVCEKNSDSDFNFDTDPIQYVEEDGWLIAKETTLGADCGIGMAAQLALLDSSTAVHGPIEALFTAEEETGLIGAQKLQPGFIEGKILINLDSEDEGELFIGCAGGVDTTAHFSYKPTEIEAGKLFYKVGFYGATGGHSGDDIEKMRANANQLLFRYLFELTQVGEFNITHVDGGNKRNAIAREAYAIIAFDQSLKERATSLFEKLEREIVAEYPNSDPELYGTMEESESYTTAIDADTQQRLIWAINAVPHGVMAMSQELEGLVETSSNLASVKMVENNQIRIGSSQRSASDSARRHAGNRIEALFLLAGAEVAHENEYPGWQPKKESPIVDLSRRSYVKLFGKEPIVRAIHAGLECGMFLKTYPYLDMVSFGPTIRGAHAPGERLEIATVDLFRQLLEEILREVK